MGQVCNQSPNITFLNAFEQKRLHRKERAKLPFVEKIRILIQLQKRAKPMLERLGKRSVVWTCYS